MEIPTLTRTGLIRAGRLAAIVALVAGVVLYAIVKPNAASPAPIEKASAVSPPADPLAPASSPPEAVSAVVPGQAPPIPEQSTRMVFGRDGDAAKAIVEVERAAGANHCVLATKKVGDATWACLVVDAAERYVDLDQGWTIEDFPSLKQQGFSEPPGPYGRTMSIYKSLAQSSLGYNRARGDRVVVIVCPKDSWDTLRMEWPSTRHNGQ